MKQNITYTLNTNQRTALANKTNYTLVWYSFYDLQPGNGACLFLEPQSPQWAHLQLDMTRQPDITPMCCCCCWYMHHVQNSNDITK